MKWPGIKAQKEQRRLVLEKYAQIKLQSGEIFTRQSISMTDGDKEGVRKVQRIVVFVVGPVLFCLIAGCLVFISSTLLFFVVLGALILIIGLLWMVYSEYAALLKSGSKELVSGVLTDKAKDSDSHEYDFELSGRDTINVGRSNYWSFELGDIVEVEQLTNQSKLGLKVKVRKLGSIFDN
jgi:hypothetical protein